MPIFSADSLAAHLPGKIGRHAITWLLALLLVAIGLWQTELCAQDNGIQQVGYSRQDRQDALQQIPFNKLRVSDQNRVAEVVKNPSIFRRLPVQVIDSDPELYSFLVSYPEVVVNIWELMGITSVQVKRLGPTQFHANDGAGTVSNVDVIYADNSTNIFFAEGYYEGPLAPKKINAHCVLVLKSGLTKADHGESFISNRLDVFVKFESRGADLLARTLHPLIGKTADYNFAETSKFIGKISKNAEENAIGMQGLIAKLEKLNPSVQQEFSQVVGRVYQRRVAAEQALQQRLAPEQTTSASPTSIESPQSLSPPAQLHQSDAARPITLAHKHVGNDEDFPPVPRKRFAELRR